MKRILAILFILTSFGASGYLAKRAAPQTKVDANDSRILGAMEGSAGASVFGEFRTNFSGYLWIKIDEYLHGGVKLRPLTDSEKQRADVRISSHVDHEDDRHLSYCDGETTQVPEQTRDWRGWFGNVERSVKPFFEVRGHKHRDPTEALPLFRFATWSDPHFIQAYVVGADVIARHQNSVGDAIAFLKEGEKYNPKSIAIKTEIGRFYTSRIRDFNTARPYLETAVRLSRGKNEFTIDEEIAVIDAYRWIILVMNKLNEHELEVQYAQEAVARFPDDTVFPRMLQRALNPNATLPSSHELHKEEHDHRH